MLNFACGETIEGKILMWDTEENVNGSVLEIYKEGALISKTVCKNGTYNINLPQGEYCFLAFYVDSEGDKYLSEENITIINSSEPITFDFILLPYLNFSEIDYEIQEFEINFSEIDEKRGNNGSDENKSNNNKQGGKDENSISWIIIGIVAIVVLIVVIFALFGIGKFWKFNTTETNKKRKNENAETEAGETKESEIKITKGMKAIMGTLTQNELAVVEILIKHNKTLTRAEISRGTGISRSSLSAALTRLEQGKIVEVDRTYIMHSVRLTEWFKSLK